MPFRDFLVALFARRTVSQHLYAMYKNKNNTNIACCCCIKHTIKYAKTEHINSRDP